MTSEQGGFMLLSLLALFLIIIGIQGNLGVAFAIFFCPSYVEISEDGGGS